MYYLGCGIIGNLKITLEIKDRLSLVPRNRDICYSVVTNFSPKKELTHNVNSFFYVHNYGGSPPNTKSFGIDTFVYACGLIKQPFIKTC